jgi:hypothetical protein
MDDDHIRYYWLGFIVAAVGIGWLIWLYRKQREVMPKPLFISGRVDAYTLPAEEELVEKPGPDDLTQIQGIGPAYARRLNENGIFSFAQLAGLDPDELQEMTGVSRWDPKMWIEQALALDADG